MAILPLDSVVGLTTWGRSQTQVACGFKGSQSFSKLLLKCPKQLKLFPAASQASGSTAMCGSALLLSKCFFPDIFCSSWNLKNMSISPVSNMQKSYLCGIAKCDACSWRSFWKHLGPNCFCCPGVWICACLDVLHVVRGSVTRLFGHSHCCQIFCGCAPREGAISGLWWLLRGVTCFKCSWLYCSTPCHLASVQVLMPDLQGSEKPLLIWFPWGLSWFFWNSVVTFWEA